MADNLTLNAGAGGGTLKTDELVDTTHVPYTKLLDPTADSTTIVGVPGNGVHGNAMRVTIASDCNWTLQAGSASIGKVGLNTGTASVGTVGLNTGTNSVGTVGLNAGTALIGSVVNAAPTTLFSANANTSAAETAALEAAPGAAIFLYITDVVVSSLTAQTTKIVSDSAGTPITEIPIIYTGANGTVTMHFQTPIKVAAANTNVGYITTAAVATSILVSGYTAA